MERDDGRMDAADEILVRAMPRRPLYALKGFVGRIDLDVLSAIADEGWCATRPAIATDVDCKEVRVGAVVVRRSGPAWEVLVGPGARILMTADVAPEVMTLHDFKDLALATAQAVVPAVRGVEMAGYYNDDADPDWRKSFLVVYRAMVAPDTAAPEGSAWHTRSSLQGMNLSGALGQIAPGVC